jgi:hypothetical protein
VAAHENAALMPVHAGNRTVNSSFRETRHSLLEKVEVPLDDIIAVNLDHYRLTTPRHSKQNIRLKCFGTAAGLRLINNADQ